MAYYGLAMNPSFLGGDKYLTFVIGGILDVFMSSILLIVNTVGRKSLIIFGFLLTSLFLFATLCIPDGKITIILLRMRLNLLLFCFRLHFAEDSVSFDGKNVFNGDNQYYLRVHTRIISNNYQKYGGWYVQYSSSPWRDWFIIYFPLLGNLTFLKS